MLVKNGILLGSHYFKETAAWYFKYMYMYFSCHGLYFTIDLN